MTLPTHLRILIVDDNAAIHHDFRKILCGSVLNPSLEAAESILFEQPATNIPLRSEFQIDSAFQGKEAVEMVERAEEEGRPYAMAFLDIRMPPGNDGIQTLELLWQVSPRLQVVLCSAYSDYSWEKMIQRLGINDNLVILKKPFDNIEALQLAHALTKKWQMTNNAMLRLETLDKIVNERTHALQSANAELNRSEERFSKAFQANPIAMAIQSIAQDRFVDMNAAFESMTGFNRHELQGRTPEEVGLYFKYEKTPSFELSKTPTRSQEASVFTKLRETRHALLSTELITLGGEPHVLLLAQDITDRLRLETQLRQSQKLEAVGQLAAGIAHDFNNLLTIIQGHASLQLASNNLGADLMESFSQIGEASERAANLTRQLLTFSRRQVLQPRVLKLNGLVADLGTLLGRLIGENIELEYQLQAGLPAIYADRTNVEQILMNLTINARDAIPVRGSIVISTTEVVLSPKDCLLAPESRPGRFVRMSVADTGMGMDENTVSRMFEPFFTTKDIDKGTGMGLATVYGIVQQHEGWIEVITAPNHGSTFSVYLPATDKETASIEPELALSAPAPASYYTVMVVEDEEAVRGLVRDIVTNDGFKVIDASNADQALALWRATKPKVDLLLTDLVMPGSTTGLELARELLLDSPNLKVVYTSGYSSDLFNTEVPLREGVNYLPKPYLSSKLVAILRRAFDPSANL